VFFEDSMIVSLFKT